MEEKTGYHPLPQPHELSEREKEDAMGAYLMRSSFTCYQSYRGNYLLLYKSGKKPLYPLSYPAIITITNPNYCNKLGDSLYRS